MNEYINLTADNIEKEHICCAIGDPKHQKGVENKKEWIKRKLKDGHIFRKLNARGKIFIEYEPIETAWVPINGKNYEYIYCLWVAGSFKGKGIGRELLEYAINDSKEKGKSGICTLVSKKKKPFIGEKKFFEHYGFKIVDTIADYELLALQFEPSETPKFNDNARTMKIDNQDFTIYYSNECPYVEYEVNELTEYAKENNIKINFIKIDSLEKAKNAPCIFNNWANFYKGEFVSNTILNANSFEKLVSMEFIKAKTIISKVKYGNEWYGVDYNMNLYKGCSHRCIYCDSRSNCYHIDNFDIVRGKENALYILEQELCKKREKGVIGIGAMSDTYNPLEKEFEQTRGALKLISKYGFGVSIDTKSDLILRDIDLLKEINLKNNVIIKFTIITPNDELSKIIEQNVCESSKRLKAIKKISDNGIYVGIMMNPVLPFITDKEEDIKKLVKLASESGARFIHTYMGMTLRENQRDYYYNKLDQNFIGLKEKYIKYYGDRYNCITLNYKRLYKIFTDECDKYGILYNMSDIIKAYRKEFKSNEQITLF